MTLGLSRVVCKCSEFGRKWKGCIIHSGEKFAGIFPSGKLDFM